MKKTLIAICSLLLAIGLAAPAEAKNNKKDKNKNTPPTVTMSIEQFQMLLEMIAAKPQTIITPKETPEKGEPGPAGSAGQKGDKGATGATGAAGQDGIDGKDGADGQDGADGKDGVGFSPGAIFLTNGACPEGTTMQGAQNRWTVYANDTNGRPWLTTGSSAQLFLSACQVN